jgi:hypothetical protein
MTGTGGTGGQPPACDDVCFYWEDPIPLPPPGVPGETLIEDCNAYGLTPGVCPSGFVCGRVIQSPVYGRLPVCEPTTPGSITTTFDLPASTPPADARDVTLYLTMNGGAWPSPAGGKDAGVLTLIRKDSEWWHTVPLPTDASGVLNLQLAPGLYTLYFSTYGADVDKAQYPMGQKVGLLQVVDDGEETANLERHQLNWTLEIDDVVETLSGQFAFLTLPGVYGQSNISVTDGESLSGTIALYPDTYSVSSRFIISGTIPQGTVEVSDGLTLDPGQSSVTWDVFTVQATGTVVVDGQGFTDSPTDVDIEFEGEDGSRVETELVAGTPGSFSVRLLPGRYDVALDVGSRAESRLPRAAVMLRTDYQTGSGPINATLSSQTVSGSVTRNNGTLSDVGSGSVRFTPRSGRTTTLSLSRTGPATFSGSVFREGIYEVSTYGDGETLPKIDYPLLSNYRPSATPLLLNVNAHLVTIPVTLEGSPLSDAPSEHNRGQVWLTSNDSEAAVYLVEYIPNIGTASVEVLVPQGSWELNYRNYSSTYFDVPYGRFTGNTITVSSPGTHPLDLRAVSLTINLTQGGMQPPAAAGGKSRGVLQVLSRTLTVPGAGPATMSLSVFPEIGSIRLYCTEAVLPPRLRSRSSVTLRA